MQQPGQRELRNGGAMSRGDAAEGLRGRMVGLEHFSACVGIPGQETDAAAFAIVERFLMTPVGETVAILDSDDGDDFFRVLDFGRA